MTKYTVLYNPKGNNNSAEAETKTLSDIQKGDELNYVDVTKIADLESFLSDDQSDAIILSGGDGTLNHFINDVDCDHLTKDLYFFGTGTGNDFLSSINAQKGKIHKINNVVKNLPTVTVKGKTYKFINGIGYGIDGYCCEVGDQLREKSDKPINYTGIAIKGLLFHYKPTNAKVTVDGVTKRYKKVWLSPTMYGRFYGGGMIPTPEQKRGEGYVSNMTYYGVGKIKALIVFPKIFEGKHVSYTKMIDVRKGKEVKVEFDRPVALQIDGETVLGVTEYTVKA